MAKKIWMIISILLAGMLLCLLPVVFVYGVTAHISMTPTERIVLKHGRNAIFMARMHGKYCVRLEKGVDAPNEASFSVDGYIKTSKSIKRISGNAVRDIGSGKSYFHIYFECEDYMEHVEVVVDVAWPTNCVHEISAVIFPRK